MKEVYYTKEKLFRLTGREFGEAVMAWKDRKNYYCLRLGTLLTPRFLFVENVDGIFYYGEEEILKVKNNLFSLKSGMLKFKNQEEKEDYEKELISEDEYLDGKKYLNC